MNRAFCKRIFAVLCTLVLIFTSVANIFAAEITPDGEGKCGDNLYWSFTRENNTLTIFGEGRMYNYNTYYYPEEAAPWEYARNVIYKIVIEEGCTSIGDNAFLATFVSEIDFPEKSLKTIGASAFSQCIKLVSIEIPDSVEFMGASVFASARALESVVLGDGLRTVERRAFSYNERLKSVTMGKGVKVIYPGGFTNCPLLTSIDLTYVEKLYNTAFSGCTGLEKVTFGENLTYVGAGVFADSSRLQKFELKNMPEFIAAAFDKGTVEYANRENGMYTLFDGKLLLSKGSFDGTKLVVPEGVEVISSACFSNSFNFTFLKIPDTVKIIQDRAFFNARSLNEVYIPDSVEYIGTENFGYGQNNGTNYCNTDFVIHASYGGAGHKYAMDNGLIFDCIHSFKNVLKVQNCTEGGYVYSVCDCGYVQSRTEVLPREHTVIDETVAPGCETEGYIREFCSECETVLSETLIPETGHGKTEDVTFGATCCENGRIDTVCTECGKVLFSVETEKAEHSAGEWVEVSIPNNTQLPTLRANICKECNAPFQYEWTALVNEASAVVDGHAAYGAVSPVMREAITGGEDEALSEMDYNRDGRFDARDILFLNIICNKA